MVDVLVENPLLLLFVVLGVGTAIGNLRWRGLGLGPAAVLFVALALSATDERLALPEVLGSFGLAVFAYAVGVTAGPSFFSSLRTGAGPVGTVFVTLVGVGALTWVIARVLGFDKGTAAGLFAGANTNTPGLAAALVRLDGAPEPTVAYSLTYIGGVLVMLAASAFVLRRAVGHPTADDAVAPPAVVNATIKVTHDNALAVHELTYTPHGRVVFSRLQTADGATRMADGATVLQPGDRVLAIGPDDAVRHLTKQLGRRSKIQLEQDRSELDFRRVFLSQRRFYGRTIADLDLWEKLGARATRVRRGDQDFLATDDFVLQAGDRIRVAAPRAQMPKVAAYLGDSEHGGSDINPLGLALGLAAGLAVGIIPIMVPGLGTFSLGSAAGPLIVGLVLGRLARTGPVVWTLPHQAAETLTQIGLLLFLAYAGGRSGSAFVDAVKSPVGLKIVLAGLLVTLVHAVALVVVGRRVLQTAGPRIAGIIAGSQTQPAVLAYANESSGFDQKVALGYALVYPVAMVTKILVAQLLTMI
ncbi:MAG: TrkA C-terminal domain-containing protein [Nocardioidaceae bacterium]